MVRTGQTKGYSYVNVNPRAVASSARSPTSWPEPDPPIPLGVSPSSDDECLSAETPIPSTSSHRAHNGSIAPEGDDFKSSLLNYGRSIVRPIMSDDHGLRDPESDIKLAKEEVLRLYENMYQLAQNVRGELVQAKQEMSQKEDVIHRLQADKVTWQADQAAMEEAHSSTVQILETERDMMKDDKVAAEIRLAEVLNDAEERRENLRQS